MGDNQGQGVISLVNEDYGKHLRRGNTKTDSKPILKYDIIGVYNVNRKILST